MAEKNQIIGEKYQIVRLIGTGGMSSVYLALDTHLNKQWAVKEIRQGSDNHENDLIIRGLVQEANLMRRFDHPALPRIVDIIEENNSLFVVMDYIEGESLGNVLSKHGPLPQDAVIDWGQQLCEVLDYLHTCTPPIIYRDMKPSNVMLKPDGSLCIIDFGIAREMKGDTVEPDEGAASVEDTTNLGTRGYAAPEQFGGMGQTDARTDVYGLGATLYHLVTGLSPAEPPYEMKPLCEIDAKFSPGLEKILEKATQSDPDERYQSCAEMLIDLQNFNKADDAYRARQLKIWRGFVGTCVACVAFLLIGAASAGMAYKSLLENYDYQVDVAQHQTNMQSMQDHYLSAVALRPQAPQAYEGLLDSYKQDALFTTDEENQYLGALMPNLTAARATGNDYAQLAFDTGKLYWYYYDYGANNGDNRTTRIIAAQRWMNDAAAAQDFKQHDLAQVYADISDFNASIVASVNEGSDAGMYAPYFEQLSTMADYAKVEENDVVKAESAELLYDAVETYARKFRADGVSKEELTQLLDKADALAKQVDPTTDKLDAAVADIASRSGRVHNQIDVAFTDITGGVGVQ